MTSINCTLVGFRHHAWRGDALSTKLANAQGQRVILMRDSENHRNREATVACVDTEVVAYVTNDECHRMATYIDHSEYGLLYGSITAVNVTDNRCTASIEVEREMEIPPAAGNTAFEEWDRQWSHLPIAHPDDHELRLHMLQRHLVCMLSRNTDADDTLCREIEKYMQIMRYDISREASVNRREIANLLNHSTCGTLRLYGKRMEVAITRMGDNEVCADVAKHISTVTAQSSSFMEMARHKDTTHCAMLEEALRGFPYALHSEFMLSAAEFVSRAYYLHIPRRALRRFISCELLFNHLTRQMQDNGITDSIRRSVEEYVARINCYASEPWKPHIDRLWRNITDTCANRITKLNGAKDTLFNARFICMVAGRLIERGVYDSTITQTEYGRRLALNGRDMRSSVNRGLNDDKDMRDKIDRMVSAVKL